MAHFHTHMSNSNSNSTTNCVCFAFVRTFDSNGVNIDGIYRWNGINQKHGLLKRRTWQKVIGRINAEMMR